MVEETLDHARHIAHGLVPVMEEGHDLVRELRRLARTTEDLCRIPCTMQEALNNVLRHAHASRIDIELSRANNEVMLRVSDNDVSGSLRLRNRQAGGTELECRVPLVS